MAFLADDDKQKKDGADDASNGQSQVDQSTQTGSGGGIVSGSGGSGDAAGGSGSNSGWTNIQAYLNANKGNTATADSLKQDVGNTFNQERGQFDTQANDTKQKAQSQVDSHNMGTDQASKLIEQAGQNYSAGRTSQPYTDAVTQLKTQYADPWGGPTSLNYNMGAPAKNYGEGLKDDTKFDAIKNALYNKAAGGQISAGQLALQRQLDTNNDAVNSARSELTNQYGDLNKYITDNTGATNDALKSYQDQYKTHADTLKNYLTGSEEMRKQAIDKAASDQNNQIEAFSNWFKDYDGSPLDSRLYQIQSQHNGPTGIGSGQLSPTWQQSHMSYNYQGDHANEGNVNGVDQQRNEYNAIADALGLSDRIDRTNPFQMGAVDEHVQGTQAGYASANPVDVHNKVSFDDWVNYMRDHEAQQQQGLLGPRKAIT
jgi:hypothetical protein